MRDWNVVVSVYEHGYAPARRFLEDFGVLAHTDFHNVLAMKVDDVAGFIERLRTAFARDPAASRHIARVVPVTERFAFQSAEEFEARARAAAERFLPELRGLAFHVRMHRRGFRRELSSQDEERRLDRYLLERLEAMDAPGRIRFDDPDAILVIETIGPWAGLSLWKREDLRRYPFLRVN